MKAESTSTANRKPSFLLPLCIGMVAGGIGGWVVKGSAEQRSPDEAIAQTSSASARSKALYTAEGSRTAKETTSSNSKALNEQSPLSDRELTTLLRENFRNPDRDDRDQRYRAMLDRLSPSQYPEVIRLIRENDARGASSGDEWETLWQYWGNNAPMEGYEFLLSENWHEWSDPARQSAANNFIETWASYDLNAAIAFVEADRAKPGVDGSAKGPGDERDFVYGIVASMTKEDPRMAADWLFKTGLGMRGEYERIADAIRQRDGFEGLEDWFNEVESRGIPPQDIRGFSNRIVDVMAERDPEIAATFIDSHKDRGWLEIDSIVNRVASHLSSQDPKRALEFSVEHDNRDAVRNSLEVFASRDVTDTAAWLNDNKTTLAPVDYARGAAFVADHLRRQN